MKTSSAAPAPLAAAKQALVVGTLVIIGPILLLPLLLVALVALPAIAVATPFVLASLRDARPETRRASEPWVRRAITLPVPSHP